MSVTSSRTRIATLQINCVAMDWDELPRRSAKPCKRCGKPTQGRMKLDGETSPACCGCSVSLAMEKGLAPMRGAIEAATGVKREIEGGKS